MSGKFIEFTNVVTGQVILKGSDFYKIVGITHYHYTSLMKGTGLKGFIVVNGEKWNFEKHFKNIKRRDYVPVPKGTKRVYNTKRIRSEKPLPKGDRENKQAPDQVYYYKEVGNFRMKYSVISDRLVSTTYVE